MKPAAKAARVVVVTGSSRGLGRAIALQFGKNGDKVVVNYLSNEENARAVVHDIIAASGDAIPFRADVSSAKDVDALINAAIVRFGRVDVLVNNAGRTKDHLLLRMEERDWDDVIETNLSGSFNCMRSVSNIMVKQRDGHIISIASIVGMQGREGQANYSASKAGLIGLTKSCARELGPYNIKVNAVLPGYLKTDMGETIATSVKERIEQENTLQRSTQPAEVAEFIFHLSRMNNVSGQIFNLDSRIV
jgi:3-oxoacyl-[acyl-carrier protein] reductase